jgi:nucleotide-binding universal stress UspA family protein
MSELEHDHGTPPSESRPISRRGHRLVVAVDFSPASDLALESAIRFAAPHDETVVHVLHVERGRWPVATDPVWEAAVITDSQRPGQAQHHLDERCTRVMDRLRDRLPSHRCRLETHVRSGPAAAEIVRLAEEVGADLVVVGTHGRTGIRRLVLGSVAEEVVRTAPCPVYVARPRTPRGAERATGT